jgi:hypothetical protein
VRFSVLTVSLLAGAAGGWAQSPTCQAVAVPPVVRSAGIAERLGDIVLKCTGPANREVTGALTVSLVGIPVTNRINGASLDVVVTIDNGTGASILPLTARLQLANQVVFDTFTFNLGPAGSAEVRISNIRADVSQRSSGIREVIAQLAFNPPGLLNFTTTNLTVGFVNRGLFATSLLGLVASQDGSPVPESLTFAGFIAKGTAFSSTRLTEGFNSGFE